MIHENYCKRCGKRDWHYVDDCTGEHPRYCAECSERDKALQHIEDCCICQDLSEIDACPIWLDSQTNLFEKVGRQTGRTKHTSKMLY